MRPCFATSWRPSLLAIASEAKSRTSLLQDLRSSTEHATEKVRLLLLTFRFNCDPGCVGFTGLARVVVC